MLEQRAGFPSSLFCGGQSPHECEASLYKQPPSLRQPPIFLPTPILNKVQKQRRMRKFFVDGSHSENPWLESDAHVFFKVRDNLQNSVGIYEKSRDLPAFSRLLFCRFVKAIPMFFILIINRFWVFNDNFFKLMRRLICETIDQRFGPWAGPLAPPSAGDRTVQRGAARPRARGLSYPRLSPMSFTTFSACGPRKVSGEIFHPLLPSQGHWGGGGVDTELFARGQVGPRRPATP